MKLRAAVIVASLLLAGAARAAPAPAASEPVAPASGDTVVSHWGPIPPAGAGPYLEPRPVAAPLWKHLVRVPWYVGSVPVNAADWTVRWSLRKAEELGLFEPVETIVRGVRDPLGNYWMPTGSIDGNRGIEYGLVGRRPHFPAPGWITRLGATRSTRRSRHLSLGTRSHVGQSEWLEIGGGSRRDPELEFYGRGWDTAEDDESVYRCDLEWLGSSWRREWDGDLESTLALSYTTVWAGRSRFEVDEALATVFAGRVPFGYGMRSSGVTASVKLGYDDTRISGNPQRGSRVVLRAERFWNTDDTDVALWTWGVSLERYLRLWLPHRTLAVKAWWLRQQSVGDDPIPFTRLLDNRDPYRLRGYDSERFRASGFTGVTVEYRWPFWIFNHPGGAGLDAYVFGDVGQPFDRMDELAVARLRGSGGVGLRVNDTERQFLVRAEIAYGGDEMHVRLTARQLFDFIKAGFHEGHEPLPIMR